MAEKRQFLRIAKKLCATFVALFAFAITPARAALPTGYTELEYIESTGTQYIDTGVSNAGGLIIETKAQPTNPSYTGDQAYVGNVQQNADKSRNLIVWKGGQWRVQKLAKYNGDGVSVADDGLNPAIIKFDGIGNNYKWWYNGTQIADLTVNGTLDSNTGNVLISKINYNDMIANGRYYYVKIWDSNESLVRNMVPAKRDSDSAIGMYDMVNGVFYTNAGSGDFIAGPEIYNLFDKNADIVELATRAQLLDIINNYTKPVLEHKGYQIQQDGSIITSINRYSFITRANENIYNVYNGQIVDPVLSTQYITADGYPADQYTGVYKISYAYNDELSESISKWATINDFVTNAMVVSGGSVPLTYIPYRGPEIKIATTAYNAAAFAPVEAALESAVTTIKDVVANTIVQADAIQNLQDTKQTMPDASGTNGTCPRFRQCLLIETDDGTPQWFVINDPFRDFVTPILANNDHITGVDTQRRYAGDLELCQMLPQTDEESQANNGIAKCTGVADYQKSAAANTVRGSALKQTEWGYEFKAANIGANPATDNPNNDEGIVYGISKCVSTETQEGLFGAPATSTQLNNALWDARPTTMAEADKYRRCWCKTTGIAYGGQYYETSKAPWVFYSTHGSAAGCASGCAGSCAYYVPHATDFRSSVLGWAVE